MKPLSELTERQVKAQLILQELLTFAEENGMKRTDCGDAFVAIAKHLQGGDGCGAFERIISIIQANVEEVEFMYPRARADRIFWMHVDNRATSAARG